MLLTALTFSSIFSAHASTEVVHSIVPGSATEPHIVRFESGRVELIKPTEEEKLLAYEAQLKSKMTLKSLSHERSSDEEKLLENAPAFQPSNVSGAEIQNIFSRMNSQMRRRSECSDRAHVWAWDEHQKSGTNSEKIFLFLTDSYIKRHNYKWWFHVAPMYTVDGQKMVLDNQFFDRPVSLEEWKNSLVFSKRACVTDFSFLAYDAGADQTQDCYMKTQSMFFRLPADIAALEKGLDRTEWNVPEVNDARARAFHKGSL